MLKNLSGGRAHLSIIKFLHFFLLNIGLQERFLIEIIVFGADGKYKVQIIQLRILEIQVTTRCSVWKEKNLGILTLHLFP